MNNVKRAFIGFAGPLGYAYGHKRTELENETSSPNAVLENVGGLLICYDELYFPTRNLCPVDMWELPYVHFLLEEDETRQQTLTAITQASGSEVPDEINRGINFECWTPITLAMQNGSREALIDNHTHGLQVGENIYLSGNSGNPKNILTDIFVAQSLSLHVGEADLILSSPALDGGSASQTSSTGISEDFTIPQRTLAEGVVTLYNRNFLSPRGGYHDSYEELRSHPNMREFRTMLAATEVSMTEVSKLALEINRKAEEFSSKTLRKIVKGPNWFRSFGIPAIASAANQIVPFSGTIGKSVVNAAIDRNWKKEIKNTSWAPFVVDAGIKGRHAK
ncbi:hypothetical protein ABNP34_03275 [Glutamicibacter mishrai]|uniref:hypothetical protein n=1 Tax=Glutamicibacter mishrai TaxID=1775880 RepID=UPI0032EC1BD7